MPEHFSILCKTKVTTTVTVPRMGKNFILLFNREVATVYNEFGQKIKALTEK
jgi:hypothetical protein